MAPQKPLAPTLPRCPFHASAVRGAVAGVGSSPPPATAAARDAPGEGYDARHAAFLGEADSDDGFETHREAHGPPSEALDAANAAFLGEADSDVGFEARRHAHPEEGDHRLDDASNAAFLGEADSDDAFVARREVHPEEGDHGPLDPADSGFHGESGEQGA